MYRLQKLPLNNKLIIALCLVGLALVGLITKYSANKTAVKEDQETVKPQPINAVTALGRIEPQGQVEQLAPSPSAGGSKLAQLYVKEGDRVTSGQTIALLDSHRRSQTAVEVARQEVKVAQADLAVIQAGAKQGDINAQFANLRRVQAQLGGEIVANEAEVARLKAQLSTESVEKQATIARLEAELRNADSEFKRYQKLAQEGVITASELDTRRLNLDKAKTAMAEGKASYNRTRTTLQQQINQAQAIALQNKNTLQQQITEAEGTLASVEEVRAVDVVKAQAEVDKAIATLHQAEADYELTSIKAPGDGQILQINAYPGETITQEDGLADFAQTSKMMVVAEVYESDIGKVKIGQTAEISSETGAFEGKISGKVEQIGLQIGKQDVFSTDPAADVDSRVVEVKIYLDAETSKRVANLSNSKAVIKINL